MRLGYWLFVLLACASVPGSPATSEFSPPALDSGLRCTGHHCDVHRALADEIIRALREGRHAGLPRIVPAIDRREGIKLYAIRPGSLFERLGFRNSDVVRAVDGVPLVGARLRAALEPLAARTAHAVEIERKGGVLTLDFTIVNEF